MSVEESINAAGPVAVEVQRSGIWSIIIMKCLHIQTAECIGLGGHPGEEWLKAHVLCSECGRERSCCWPHSL